MRYIINLILIISLFLFTGECSSTDQFSEDGYFCVMRRSTQRLIQGLRASWKETGEISEVDAAYLREIDANRSSDRDDVKEEDEETNYKGILPIGSSTINLASVVGITTVGITTGVVAGVRYLPINTIVNIINFLREAQQ